MKIKKFPESDSVSSRHSATQNHRNLPSQQFAQRMIKFSQDPSPVRRSADPSCSSSSSRECLNSGEEEEDGEEVFNRSNANNTKQSYHSERTLLASHSSQV